MKKLLTIFFITMLSFVILNSFVLASTEDAPKTTTDNTSVKLTNPLGPGADKTDIPKLLGQIINYAMGIIGSLALVMFIYGGITWMLSGGNQEQVAKGKNVIIWATLGLAIIFTAYALVKFVIMAIGGQ